MAKSISSLLSAFKRRRWPALATSASVIAASVAYLWVTPSVYQVTSRIILDDKKVSVSELGRDLSQGSSGTPGGPSPLANQVELVRSQRVLKGAYEKVFPGVMSSSQEKLISEKLKKKLKVKIVPATNILELSYQDRDPVVATKLLNAIVQTMIEESTEALRSEAKAVRQFLEREIPKKQAMTQAAEAAENRYRQVSGIVSFEEQTKSLVNSLAALEDQERVLSSQLQGEKAQVKELQQITDNSTLQDAYAAGRLGQDAELKDLRVKLADIDAQLAKARSRFTDDNPTIVSLLSQRDATLALYNKKASRILPASQAVSPANIASDELSQNLTSKFIVSETERLALEQRLKILQAERSELQTRLAQLPIKQQPLTLLTRQREEAVNSLKLLQSKLEEARIAEAQLVSNIRIIELAQPPSSASGPNKKAILVVGAAFGIILAVSIILLLEMIDNRLHDAVEAEELLKQQFLGVLPNIPKAALSLEEPDRFLDNAELVEPYRRLLKTLEFRSREKLQLIVVTSTLSGEGKSLVVSHLAAVSAMSSRRTLIIDADLRQPKQHNLLHSSREPGLADVIDKKITLLHAVQPTDIENLSILTCGELCDRPASLLESPAMKMLLEEAAAHYDLVILDTPSASTYTDANALSQFGNGLLMIVRPNFIPKEMLLQTVSKLTGDGVPLLGVVVNGMTDHKQKQKFDRNSVTSYQFPSKPLKPWVPLETPVNNSIKGSRSVSLRALNNDEQ